MTYSAGGMGQVGFTKYGHGYTEQPSGGGAGPQVRYVQDQQAAGGEGPQAAMRVSRSDLVFRIDGA